MQKNTSTSTSISVLVLSILLILILIVLFREGQSGPQTPQSVFDADFEGLTRYIIIVL